MKFMEVVTHGRGRVEHRSFNEDDIHSLYRNRLCPRSVAPIPIVVRPDYDLHMERYPG